MMRNGIVVCTFVLAAGLLLGGDLKAGSLEPPGPPGPTMKSIDETEPRIPISSLPFTIATPGSYYLTRDLVGVSGQVGINITSSFVTLDLNGFSLVGVAGSLDGIRAEVAGSNQVGISNGRIRNWGGRGISAINTLEFNAEDLRLASNLGDGMRVGARSIVRNTISSGNGGNGIQVGVGSTVIGCKVAGNTQSGVVTGDHSLVSSTTATNHTAVTQSGITLNTGSIATDCLAQQNYIGINAGFGGRIVHSVARNNFIGINGGGRASIEECTADGNTDDGILIAAGGLVRGNVASANGGDGIHAADGNRIEDNEVTTNSSAGIRVTGANNLVVKNSAWVNTTEYSIAAGNQVGTISTNPATAGPWANFDQ